MGGVHVQEFMENLMEEDPERFKVAFAKFIENDIEADGIVDLYKEVHSNIREDPKFTKKEKADITNTRKGNKIVTSKGTEYTRCIKRSYKQRKDRVKQKMASAIAKA